MYIKRQIRYIFIFTLAMVLVSCNNTLKSASQEIESRQEQLATLEEKARERIHQKGNDEVTSKKPTKDENRNLLLEVSHYIYDNFKDDMESLAYDLVEYEPEKNSDIPKKLTKELAQKVTDFNTLIEEEVYEEKGLEIGFGSITLTQPLSVDFSVKLKRPYSGYIAIVYTTELSKIDEEIINQKLSDNWCILEPVFDDF